MAESLINLSKQNLVITKDISLFAVLLRLLLWLCFPPLLDLNVRARGILQDSVLLFWYPFLLARP